MAYRSNFEKKIAGQLTEQSVKFKYETKKIAFVQPEKQRTYLIDFQLPNGIIVETKGRLTTEDRQKMILVKEQHPDLDIRFVFQNANVKIRKGSNTTYKRWAEQNGFKWANKEIPKEWIDE